MFSYNSKHGWCTGCVGTGLALTREQRKAYDDSVRPTTTAGREQNFPSEERRGRRRRRAGLRRLRRHAAEPGVARDHVRRRSRSPRSRAWSVGDVRRWIDAPAARAAATPTSRATWSPRSAAAWSSWRTWGSATSRSTARRPTLSRRRGAAHPPRGAARQQPAGRVLRARRADHRPAPARQPHPARRAGAAGRQGQHAGGGRARRRHDPPRRPHHRHRPGRRQARRPPGRAGQPWRRCRPTPTR